MRDVTLDSLVALDVNPGGATTRGHLGVAEIVGDEVATWWELGFTSPRGRLHDGRLGDASEFLTAWAFVDAFIAGRPVVVHGAGAGDVPMLRKLFAAAEVSPPELAVWCTLDMVGREAVGARRVWSLVVAQGWMTAAEVRAIREASPRSTQRIAASQDARACGLVLLGVARERGCSVGDLLRCHTPWLLSPA